MALNLTQKLIKEHLVSGEMQAGREISIKIDQTLTQDATGTTAYLEFEAIGTKKVKTELSVSYIDHNTLQTGYENADDHAYLKSVAARYGLYCSRAGNGICHQVHLERFAKPGATLLGSDSHTPTCGGMGMLAIGAGGVDVAAAMAGYPLFLNMPRVVNVRLTGRLRPWVSAKDIILEMLRRLTVKGGVGKVFEYTGEGAEYLSVPERSTIANMGAELGATSSVFASDEQTKRFLAAQGREGDFTPLSADKGASYDEEMEIDLSALDSLIAQPHMPDRVVPVKELSGLKIDQVFVGSCTNSSYMDLVRVAKILKGKTVHPDVSMTVAPGSRQAFEMIAREGYLADLIQSGVRILESACGPCAGLGQAPQTNGVSLRTSNRNFEGRCGSLSAKVYLAGAETCAISAINGVLTEPSTFEGMTPVEMPKRFIIDDSMIIKPSPDDGEAPIKRGPGIVALPEFQPLENAISSPVVLKLDDNISTDHIIPAGANILSLRSDAPKLARFAFSRIDPDFYERIQKEGNGIIVAGQNYGQGSSREHAALCPRILGVRVVIAKSFARIHQQNLVNFGIVPLIFENEEAYDHVHMNDRLEIDDLVKNLLSGVVPVKNITRGGGFSVKNLLTSRQTNIVISGGLLKYVLDYSPLHAHD